jgi:hypothetical protein
MAILNAASQGFFAAATIFGKIRLIGRIYWIILPVSHTTAD